MTTIEPPDIQDIISDNGIFIVDSDYDNRQYHVEIYYRISDRTHWELIYSEIAGRECYKTIKQVKPKTVTTTKWVYVND